MDREEERDRLGTICLYVYFISNGSSNKDKIKDKRQMEKRREVSFDAREKQSPSSKHLPAGFFKKINFHSG